MIEHSARVREQLNALPEIPLPDKLWQRVEAGRRERIQRLKLGAGVAAIALVAIIAMPLLAPFFTGSGVGQGVQTVASQPVSGERDIQAEVRALDHALQVAYDRGASDAEIAPMWVVREALLADSRSGNPPLKHDRI